MRLLKSKTGNLSIGVLIGFIVFILVAVTLLPTAKSTITASLGNFSGAEQAILGLVVLMVIVGIVIAAMGVGGIKSK